MHIYIYIFTRYADIIMQYNARIFDIILPEDIPG